MAFLPKEATTLKGGCFCKAIRYTIDIPSIEDRQLVPDALPTTISHDPTSALSTLFPLVSLDHCESCRRASGGIVQCWAICPAEWIHWRFLLRDQDAETNSGQETVSNFKHDENIEEKPHISLSTLDAVTPRTPKKGAIKTDTSNPSLSPTAQTFITHVNSSPDAYRSFCARCGTNLTFFYDRPESSLMPPIVDITVGSLDSESLEKIRPDRHGWWDDGTEWIKKLLREGDGGVLIRHPTGRLNSAVDG
jgi:hypothetical protein